MARQFLTLNSVDGHTGIGLLQPKFESDNTFYEVVYDERRGQRKIVKRTFTIKEVSSINRESIPGE